MDDAEADEAAPRPALPAHFRRQVEYLLEYVEDVANDPSVGTAEHRLKDFTVEVVQTLKPFLRDLDDEALLEAGPDEPHGPEEETEYWRRFIQLKQWTRWVADEAERRCAHHRAGTRNSVDVGNDLEDLEYMIRDLSEDPQLEIASDEMASRTHFELEQLRGKLHAANARFAALYDQHEELKRRLAALDGSP